MILDVTGFWRINFIPNNSDPAIDQQYVLPSKNNSRESDISCVLNNSEIISEWFLLEASKANKD